MRLIFCLIPFLATVMVSAHFQLQYPAPRGPFVMNSEPTFCDGYNDAVDNRTIFPLDNGIISLNSEHPMWSVQVFISTAQDPNNASLFNTTSNGTVLPLAKQPFSATGEGLHCFPIDIGALGIPGVGNGSNVSIQIEFNGGDGNLFQCADLTLFSNATIPSNVTCTNMTSSGSSNSSSNSTGSGSSSGAIPLLPAGINTGLLGGFISILVGLAVVAM